MVSKSPRRRVWRVKKFALRARNTPNLTFLRLLGEFCRENTDGAVALGEFCRGLSGGRGRAGRILSRLPDRHRPRNSPWPDPTPAPPPTAGPAARPFHSF